MFRSTTHFIFVFGFIAGTLLSFLVQTRKSRLWPTLEVVQEFRYEEWFNSKKCTRKNMPFDSLRYSHSKHFLESEFLQKSISVLCLIIVSKDRNIRAAENTWGKGCNTVNAIKLKKKLKIFPLKQNRTDEAWLQLCEALKKVTDIYEWVLVVNDDTFVIMENLRYFVAFRNASDNFYLGYPVKFWNTLYNIGKAGYVLSQGVIKSMQTTTCNNNVFYQNREDFTLGNHLASLNISVMDTRDEKGLSVFHPYNLNRLLFPDRSQYIFKEVYERKCCSRYTITFNGIEGDKMYTYYYLLHTLQLFYYGRLGNRQADKVQDKEVWQSFLEEQNLPLNVSADQYYHAWVNLIDSPNLFGRNMKREDYLDET